MPTPDELRRAAYAADWDVAKALNNQILHHQEEAQKHRDTERQLADRQTGQAALEGRFRPSDGLEMEVAGREAAKHEAIASDLRSDLSRVQGRLRDQAQASAPRLDAGPKPPTPSLNERSEGLVRQKAGELAREDAPGREQAPADWRERMLATQRHSRAKYEELRRMERPPEPPDQTPGRGR